ncbi:MAG: hypothetical protein QT08_C0020G0002 [archaeon GW2011_AR17]|nr:MAG: hypothetical protein QT08_C0020G0002 [archaeon GW2011_AR17]
MQIEKEGYSLLTNIKYNYDMREIVVLHGKEAKSLRGLGAMILTLTLTRITT